MPKYAAGVYGITNSTTNDLYIGSSVNVSGRWMDHRSLLRKGVHHNAHLQNAWNKYGEASFVFERLEPCAAENCVRREQWWMNLLLPAYNICSVSGSTLGVKHTKPMSVEHRAAISASHIGKKLSPEHRAAVSAKLTGRKLSPEHRARLSVVRKGKQKSPEHCLKLSAAGMGHEVTAETRSKLSVAHIGIAKGKPWPQARRQAWEKGGRRGGHWRHRGRPGHRGGSLPNVRESKPPAGIILTVDELARD